MSSLQEVIKRSLKAFISMGGFSCFIAVARATASVVVMLITH